MSAFSIVGLNRSALQKFLFFYFFLHKFKSIFEISALSHPKQLRYWVKMLLFWPSASTLPARLQIIFFETWVFAIDVIIFFRPFFFYQKMFFYKIIGELFFIFTGIVKKRISQQLILIPVAAYFQAQMSNVKKNLLGYTKLKPKSCPFWSEVVPN